MIKKSFNSAKSKRKLDKMFSQFILGRDNRICLRCGRVDGKHDCSHIIPREILKLRWDKRNATCLCFRCHKLIFHKNPLLITKWLQSYIGNELCDQLLTESTIPYEFNEAEYTRIKTELELKNPNNIIKPTKSI